MKHILMISILLILTSCATGYRGKDFIKSKKQVNKQFNKIYKQFEANRKIKDIFIELKKDKFQKKNQIISELQLAFDACDSEEENIKKVHQDYLNSFNQIKGIKKKKIYTKKDGAKFSKMKAIVDSYPQMKKDVQSSIKVCQKTSEKFKKHKIGVLNVEDFNKPIDDMRNNDLKIKDALKKLSVLKTKVKNKFKSKYEENKKAVANNENNINKNYKKLKVIQKRIQVSSSIIKKKYRKNKVIAYYEGSENFQTVNEFKKQLEEYKTQANLFSKHVKEGVSLYKSISRN